MFDVNKIRQDFPMLKNKIEMQNKTLVFLDNASTTLKPKSVIEACNFYYEKQTSNAGRGDYDLMYKNDVKISECRKSVARFINAKESEIVFTSGDTMGLNEIAFGFAEKILNKNDEILITTAEHASNVLPWFKLSKNIGCKVNYINLSDNGLLTLEEVKKAINSHTKIISIANVTNVLGIYIDIEPICKYAHEHGIIVVCDGAQSVPHIRTDVKKMDVDFLVFSGHKMCGPTGIGVLYGKKELLDKMDPYELGGGMNIDFSMNGEYECKLGVEKLEAGTLNVDGIYGLNAAIEYLEKIGMENISKYERELREYAVEKMKKIKDLVIYNEEANTGIIAFNIKGIFSQDLATLLNSKGIAVRSGNHCAKMLKNQINELATVRASFYFYNTKEEIDVFVDALKEGGNFLDAYFA